MHSSNKRVGLNSLSLVYGQVTSFLIQIVQIPIFLQYWGESLYSEWLVLTGLASALTIFDFGITKAAESRAIALQANGDRKRVEIVLHTAQLYTVFAILCLTPFFFLSSAFDIRSLLKISELSLVECKTICISMLVTIAVSLQFGMVDAKFKVAQRNPLGQFMLANRRLLTLLTIWICLSMGSSASLVAICIAVCDVHFLIIAELLLLAFIKGKINGIRNWSIVEFKETLKPALAYSAFPISQIITLQGGVQLLNQFASSSQVVEFTLVRTLVRLVAQIGMVTNNALKPEVSRLAGLGDVHGILRIGKQWYTIAIVLAVICFTGLVIVGPRFIFLWSDGKVQALRYTICLVGIHAILNILWIVPAAISMGLNRHSSIGFYFLSASIASFALWICFPRIDSIFAASMLLAIPEAVALMAVARVGWNLGATQQSKLMGR